MWRCVRVIVGVMGVSKSLSIFGSLEQSIVPEFESCGNPVIQLRWMKWVLVRFNLKKGVLLALHIFYLPYCLQKKTHFSLLSITCSPYTEPDHSARAASSVRLSFFQLHTVCTPHGPLGVEPPGRVSQSADANDPSGNEAADARYASVLIKNDGEVVTRVAAWDCWHIFCSTFICSKTMNLSPFPVTDDVTQISVFLTPLALVIWRTIWND